MSQVHDGKSLCLLALTGCAATVRLFRVREWHRDEPEVPAVQVELTMKDHGSEGQKTK